MADEIPIDIELLKRSYKTIELKQASFTSRFYERLFADMPDVQKLFKSVGMEMQGKMVLQAVKFSLDNLPTPEELTVVLQGLGRRHELYGVKPQYYDHISDAFIGTVQEYLGDECDQNLVDNWQRALDLVTSIMKSGSVEKKSTTPSATPRFNTSLETLDDPYLSRFFKGRITHEEVVEPNECPSINKGVAINYLGEKEVKAFPMQTILDISHENDIPHICECKGRARCSTCRVMIIDGLENCLPRSALETRMADKKGLSPEIRLACQTRVTGDVMLKRLVRDESDIVSALSGTIGGIGQEIEGAVLFTDIWDFTAFSEKNLPYDVIHALNRLYEAMGQTVDDHDGFVDKYIGDCLMAIFGLDEDNPERTCKNAANAALGIIDNVEEVNQYLRHYLGDEFRMSVGVAYGSMVVGEVGFRLKKQFTAIGDTVNIAARLQSETRDINVDLLVSDSLAQNLMQENFDFFNTCEFSLKGKKEKVVAHQIRAK